MIDRIENAMNSFFTEKTRLRPSLSALVFFAVYLLLAGVMYRLQTSFPSAETALRLAVTPFATTALCLALWRLVDIRPNDPRRSMLHRSLMLIYGILMVFYVIGAVKMFVG
ncbi:MAG: hypothetical protein E7559_06590 [Ruminococcaceae bacterium]|nr:hypothetical protein [Oscillospiraceae bacterium]